MARRHGHTRGKRHGRARLHGALRRGHKRLRRFVRPALTRPLPRVLLAASLSYLLLLNLAVRHLGGGDAHPLSASYVPQKSYAVLALGLHALTHLWSEHPREPDEIATHVSEIARRHGVPERFAVAIARAESSFRPHSISATGAMGLMQLMPATAREHGVLDPFDPAQSAVGAARYLRRLLERYEGDPRRAAAAYNAGPARVPKTGPLHLPAETRAYVRRVLPYSPALDALPKISAR